MSENETGRKQCPACAREIKDHWNFCSYCGTQLKEEIQLREYAKVEINVDGKKIMQAALEAIRGKS